MPHATTPEAAGAAGRRMSLSQIVELLLQRGGGEHSSVTLSRNSKGDTQIEVVVRTGESGDVTTAAEALTKAMELYDQARRQYPMADGRTGASS